MSTTAIIVDDEQHAIDSFYRIAMEAYPSLEILKSFTRPDKFLEYITPENTPDLLFLDIEMSPYSGFRLLEFIQEKLSDNIQFDVIFLTAYNQYAIKAFKYNALDYLLKPLIPDDLKQTLLQWEERKNKYLHPVQLEQLEHFLQNPGKKQDRMALPTFEGYVVILFDNIVRFEADRNYVKVFCADGKTHLACRSLKELEGIICNHDFQRIHYSHIINPDYITKILRVDGGAVEMKDGCQIRITRNKKDNIAKLFQRIQKL